jgi:transposase
MYKVLDKDTINKEIVPHLPVPKRGLRTKSDIAEIVNCILYKLKTGCQWYMLPVDSLFSGVVLNLKLYLPNQRTPYRYYGHAG